MANVRSQLYDDGTNQAVSRVAFAEPVKFLGFAIQNNEGDAAAITVKFHDCATTGTAADTNLVWMATCADGAVASGYFNEWLGVPISCQTGLTVVTDVDTANDSVVLVHYA